MKRLTNDNPKDNIETALNLFYIKDHETWVRGGGLAPEYADISLFDFIRRAVAEHIPDAELPEHNDDLSMMLAEWLMDDIDTAEGVLALLYTAAWAYAELRHRLAAYEDTGLEPEQIIRARDTLGCFDHIGMKRGNEIVTGEQEGRLLVLPCKVGDPVWLLAKKCKHAGEKNKPWESCTQYWNNVYKKGMWGCAGKDDEGNDLCCEDKKVVWYAIPMKYSLVLYQPHIILGKNLFLTQEEAEKALKGEQL